MNSNHQPRRLQFTLRTILIAFAVVSLALTVYRWPWEEVREDADAMKAVSTYRRNWQGAKALHGEQRTLRKTSLGAEYLAQVDTYVDNDRRKSIAFDETGKTVAITQFRHRKMQGPYLYEAYGTRVSGQFEQDDKVGRWICEYGWGNEHISVDQCFEEGQPQGEWIWKSAAGESLQTARFERGQLTHWNAEPVRKAIVRWYRANHVDDTTMTALETQTEDVLIKNERLERWGTNDTLLEWPVRANSNPIVLQIASGDGVYPNFEFRFDRILKRHLPTRRGRAILDDVLEISLLESRVPVYRLGVVCLVPIAESELNWRYSTGVESPR